MPCIVVFIIRQKEFDGWRNIAISLIDRYNLRRKLSTHELHRRLARGESAFQLSVLDRGQHLFESRTGLISRFDQIAAGN